MRLRDDPVAFAFAVACLFALNACASSSTSGPSVDGGATPTEDSMSARDSSSPIETGMSADTSTASGLRCLVTSGSCICLDPAPSSYTSTSCPAMPCCWTRPGQCTCSTYTGAECETWRDGKTPAASCP